MNKLMIGAAALALLTACGQDDPAPTEETLSELTVRSGDPAKAADALAAMALSDSGSGVFAFAGSDVDGATATFTNVTVAGEDAVQIGTLVFEGLDMTDAGASFGKLSLNDITLSDPEAAEGEVKLGNISLVNPSPELAAWIAGVAMDGEPDAPFPAAENLSFDSWSMSDLTGSFDEEDAAGTFGIAGFEIREMGDLMAKRATLTGVTIDVLDEVEGMDLDFNIDSISASNVDAKFVKAIQENIGDEEAMLSAIVETAYDNPMDPGYDTFKLSNLTASLSGANFALPSIDAYIERNDAGQPVKYVTKPYAMTLTADPEGGEIGQGLLQGLSVVGYESVELKGESIAAYDPDKDIVDFPAESNYIELVDGAKFSFGGKVEGYTAYSREVGQSFNIADLAEGAEPDPMAMQAALGLLTFHNLEISIKDDSLVDRAFNAIATSQGQDPSEMKSQVAMFMGMAPMMAQGSGIDMALVTEMTGALSAFISEPGELTIKLSPSEPLSIADVMANPDPAAYTKDSLGFTATAK